jgi:hypothetical protein
VNIGDIEHQIEHPNIEHRASEQCRTSTSERRTNPEQAEHRTSNIEGNRQRTADIERTTDLVKYGKSRMSLLEGVECYAKINQNGTLRF